MAFSAHSVAHFSSRKPWLVVGAWVVLLVIAMGLIGTFLATATTTTADTTANPDSKVGKEKLEEIRGKEQAHESIVVRSSSVNVNDPAFKAKLDNIAAQVSALGPEVVDSVTTYSQSGIPALVSADQKTTIIPITMTGTLDDAVKNVEDIVKIVDAENGRDGFEVYISGQATIGNDFNHAAEQDIVKGETIGGAVALIVLLLVLGTLTSALIPLLIAVVAIIAAMGMTALTGQAFKYSFFVTNMITMMGLAVGIDYCLFVISRFREERGHGKSVQEAVDTASSTAGRAVLFSGLTVIIALLGMLIVPSTIYRSVAMGAVFVVTFAIIASLTLLPAVLRLLGDKVNSLRLPIIGRGVQTGEERPGGFWDKVANTVMRHPVIGVVGVTVILIAASIPYFSINAGSAGVDTLPDKFDSKQGFQVLAQEFKGADVSPAEIVIDGDANSPAVSGAVTKLQQIIAGANDPVFGPATYEKSDDGSLSVLSVQVAIDPYADEANRGIERLRNQYIPEAFNGVDASVYVTGLSAVNLDGINTTSDYTPIVFVFVLGLSFILLMMVFRSIVVPAKAIVMNLLSVGAAYGLLVLVIQKGFLNEVFGFQQVETIEFWLPLFLFSVLFGLSMDYHVFLLSRIKEHYDQTGDNTESVGYGLRTTGRLITGAALIMVAVFGGFAMGDLVMLQQLGFGLGVSVLLDATIIRSILVPSSMKLLGKWNWYFPSALRWMPHLGIEEATPVHQPAPQAARQEARSV
ncbi:MAG: MMPL family transporter [Dehalococcoidia bacterium]